MTLKERRAWRNYVLGLLRRGEVSQTEAGWLAAVSPQVVSYWCRVAGVDVRRARRAWLVRRRADGQRYVWKTAGVKAAVPTQEIPDADQGS